MQSDIEDGGVNDDGGLVLAGLLRNLLILAEQFGLSYNALLSEAGLSPETLTDPNQMVPMRYLEHVLNAGVKDTGDDLLGLHLAEFTQPESFGVAGYIVRACGTLREVIEMCMRYEHLVSSVGSTSFEFRPGQVAWTWNLATTNPVFRSQAVDYMLGSLATVRVHLPNITHWDFDCVLLQRRAPEIADQLREYERVFRCPVHFGQPTNALVFPLAALDAPLLHSNSAMRDVLESHARSLESKQTEPDFLGNARAILKTMVMRGKPSRSALADALGMSSRHLLRRLSDEGGSYRALLGELREEMARKLLLESNESIEAIAHRLQYTESQSFIRWFKACHGMTPSQFRQQAANQGNEER
ncbi:AraC family transcriptional regulator [Marinobacter sp. DUT-3]|uniref:AraC family transcriptional regulator n=1 Tax=Marinobacter sp. DUT-3 TaxID=3412036 RepID=UPI003D17FE5B